MHARFVLQALLAMSICAAISACYRMPSDDDYSLVPMVNHPDYTKGGAQKSAIPGLPAGDY